VAKAEGPAADVEKLVVRRHPDAVQDRHLGPRGFPPAAADDVAVAAVRDRLVIEAGGEVG
jgi:hypothetical protein